MTKKQHMKYSLQHETTIRVKQRNKVRGSRVGCVFLDAKNSSTTFEINLHNKKQRWGMRHLSV